MSKPLKGFKTNITGITTVTPTIFSFVLKPVGTTIKHEKVRGKGISDKEKILPTSGVDVLIV